MKDDSPVERPRVLDDPTYVEIRAYRTPWRRVNQFIARFPLTFAVIVVSVSLLAVATAASFAFASYGARVNDNTVRLDAIDRHSCLEAAYDFALVEWVGSFQTQDPAVIEAKRQTLADAALDLLLDAAAGRDSTVVCRPVLPDATTPATSAPHPTDSGEG